MAYQETPAARLRALRQRWEADRSSRVFLQLAEEYRRQGMPSEALPVLEEGLRHHGSSIAGQVALGRCRLELGQAEGAAAILEKVVDKDPTQMVAYRTLVDAYTKLGAPSEARDRLSHYSQLNPQDPEIEALDGQIAVLERAVAAGPLAAPPRHEAPEPAERAPDAAGITGAAVSDDGEEEMVAALWPAQPSEVPIARGWSSGSADAGWISQPPVAPTADSAPQQQIPPPPPSWRGGLPASDAPTAMFSPTDEAPPSLADEPADERPGLDGEPDEPSTTGSFEARERETVQFALSELRGVDSPFSAPSPEWRARPATDVSSGWLQGVVAPAEPPPAAELSPRAEHGTSARETAELEAAAPAEPWEDGADHADESVPGTPDSGARRSWSIGESEIVFSLPARPLLRDPGDLAVVPWRPLAPPAWSQARSTPVPARFAAEVAAPASSSTPTLAQLYLKQGHAEEAAEMFEQVLEREPENVVARAGLERLQRESARLTARSLLSGFQPEGGLSAKQAHVLRRWATLLREAHLRNAP